jgi:large subunit ribosomal protein L13
MAVKIQKSYMESPITVQKQWYLIDAENLILGRLASDIAVILMGKHHPQYTPHVDTGDFIIVTNVDKLKVTGRKLKKKIYFSWSGYPGGLKKKRLDQMLEKSPEKVLSLAVRRMLPKTSLGLHMLKKLKMYKGTEHPHQAQCPLTWKNFSTIGTKTAKNETVTTEAKS